MQAKKSESTLVRVGDMDGLGTIYSQWGGLVLGQGEKLLTVADGWELEAMSPWRRLLPGIIFAGFGGPVVSKLYVTTERIVLVRQIDTWRELKGEMTPLGLPKAAEKEARLKKLKAAGARQYCQVRPSDFRLIRSKKFTRSRSVIDLFLVGSDRRKYALTYWTPRGSDHATLGLVESRFTRDSLR